MTIHGPHEAQSIFSAEVTDVDAYIQRVLDEEALLEASHREALLDAQSQASVTNMQRRRFLQLCGATAAVVFARPIVSMYDEPAFERYDVYSAPGSQAEHDAIENLAENITMSDEPEIEYSAEKVSIAWLPPTVTHWSPLIERIAKQHNQDPNFLAILIAIESSGNPFALSPADAKGLGQITPSLQNALVLKYNLTPSNMYEPEPNLEYMITLMDELITRYQPYSIDEETFIKAIAADYNGGPSQAKYVLSGSKPSAIETRDYIEYTWGMWQERKMPKSAMYDYWLSKGGQGQVDRAFAVRADFPAFTI